MERKERYLLGILAVAAFSLLISNTAFPAPEEGQDMTGAIKDLELRAVAIAPADANIMFTGSSQRLYRSVDTGKNWEEVFTVYGDGKVNFIAVDKNNSKIVYLATSNGLFRSTDGGGAWDRIFKGIGEGERGINSVSVNPLNTSIIYAGTDKGIFESEDKGENWRNISSGIVNAGVKFIAINPAKPSILYIAATAGAFKTEDRGKHWERIFVTSKAAEETAEEAGESESYDSEYGAAEGEYSISEVNCIAISPLNAETIYLGTQNGVFVSKDAGKEWRKLSSAGLENEQIKFIAISCSESPFIYAAAGKGVFKFDETAQIWQKIYKGITAESINMIAFDARGNNLWAAGSGGIFKVVSQNKNAIDSKENPLSAFSAEPTIKDVQHAAIKYAEVEPEKIKGWRRGAMFRSLFPELNVGYDKTVDYDSGSDKYYIGPYDWGVDVTWDLADLIWNPYQKDIDVRSRLMVQLRDDVLDEVTHLYYERRRLRTEMLLSPPADERAKIDKELRLEELTAGIDALTGGYFSQALNEKNKY